MPLHKSEYKGYVDIASGKISRFPEGGRVSTPLSGFYVHNLSDNYIYVDWDRDATPEHSFPIYDWEWKDFEEHLVERIITFYCASAARVFLFTYSDLGTENVLTDEKIDLAPPLAPDPFVRDPEFFDEKEPPEDIPPLNLIELEDDESIDLEPM